MASEAGSIQAERRDIGIYGSMQQSRQIKELKRGASSKRLLRPRNGMGAGRKATIEAPEGRVNWNMSWE